MKKTLLIAFMTSLSSIGCQTLNLPEDAPKPKPIPKCDLIATAATDQYLRCKWDGQGEEWRVSIHALYKQKTKYTCTTVQGYADAWAWAQEMNVWIDKNCKK